MINSEEAIFSRVWIDGKLLQEEYGVDVLLSTDEPASPNIRNTAVVIPGRHGAYDFGGEFEPRVFTLQLVFKRQGYDLLKKDLRRLNASFLDKYGRPKTVELAFGDAVGKHFYARLTGGIDVNRVAERGFVSIPLTAYDPYIYDSVSRDEVLWGSETVTFEWDYLLGMGGTSGTGGGISLNGPRTFSEYIEGVANRPTFVIKGSASTFKVTVGDESFSLPAFNNVEWEIDGEEFNVSKDGVSSLKDMTGDFITLYTGDNTIAITGTGINVELTVKYRNKYI